MFEFELSFFNHLLASSADLAQDILLAFNLSLSGVLV